MTMRPSIRRLYEQAATALLCSIIPTNKFYELIWLAYKNKQSSVYTEIPNEDDQVKS